MTVVEALARWIVHEGPECSLEATDSPDRVVFVVRGADRRERVPMTRRESERVFRAVRDLQGGCVMDDLADMGVVFDDPDE